jgi:predicted dehydrogenase
LGANGEIPPSEKLTTAVIVLGWRGIDLLHDAFRVEGVQVVALADVDLPFLLRAMHQCDEQYKVTRPELEESGSVAGRPPNPPNAVDPYHDYRRILERKDINSVIIAVPDHWHAIIAVQACEAGKDVYCEKPLSLTIRQGREIVRAVRENNIVFQVGSQQRSDSKFRLGCELVRSGRIGKLQRVEVSVGGAPQKPPVPDAPIPPSFDWDFWLGPAPYVPYNPERARVNFRWFFDYSGGMVTDWGAHHLDIAQWGMGTDRTGPRTIEGKGETSPGMYETLTSFDITYTYDNGIPVHFSSGPHGVTFIGDKGEVFVDRGKISSKPEEIIKEPLGPNDVHLYESDDHFRNWVDCVKSRKEPIADVEIGHRSATICHLGNIACRIGRKLEWDPETEMFVNDREANHWLDRPMRKPYDYAF